MKETMFNNNFVKVLKRKYPYMYKLKVHGHNMQKTGVPDNLFCIKGKFVAIEFKIQRHGKISTKPKQIKEINKIKNSGGIGLFIAMDESTKKILIREKRLDHKKLFLSQEKIRKYISIDWDFTFNYYEDAVDLINIYIGG